MPWWVWLVAVQGAPPIQSHGRHPVTTQQPEPTSQRTCSRLLKAAVGMS